MSPERRPTLALRVETALWLAFAAAAWLYAEATDRTIFRSELHVMSWPRFILYLAFATALLNFVFAGARPPLQPAVAGAEDVQPVSRWRVFGTFAVPVAYLALLPGVGFYAGAPFFLIAYMVAFGQRKPRHLIGTALVAHVVLSILFTKYLFMPLPTGNWPGFYEFNVAVVRLIKAW